MLLMIGVAALLTHRAANKKRAKVEPQIESKNAETANLERIVEMMRAECRRIESLTLQTVELGGTLKTTLSSLQANVNSLKITGVALADAMNAPGFNFPDPLTTQGQAPLAAHSAC